MRRGSVGSGVGHTYNLLNCKQSLVVINDSQLKKTSIYDRLEMSSSFVMTWQPIEMCVVSVKVLLVVVLDVHIIYLLIIVSIKVEYE